MTEEQKNINKELYEIREKFIKKYGIECSSCMHHKESGLCTSRTKCIVNE